MTGALYKVVKWSVGVLPVDDAGQRCFDETLADWRREETSASGRLARLGVSLRAVFSVFRCVAGVSVREVLLIRQSGVLPRVLLWTASYVATVTLIVQFSPGIRQGSTVSRFYFLVMLIASFLPVALLLAAGLGGKRRPLPGLGLGLAALVIAVPLLGWALPTANLAAMKANDGILFVVEGREMRNPPHRPGDGLMLAMGDWERLGPITPSSSFINDQTIVQLGRRIVGGPEAGGWNAIRWMSFFFAYVTACALIPVLASTLKRGHSLVRYLILVVTAGLVWTQGSLPRPFVSEFSIVWWLGAYWIPVAWMGLCLVAVARRSGAIGAADRLR